MTLHGGVWTSDPEFINGCYTVIFILVICGVIVLCGSDK